MVEDKIQVDVVFALKDSGIMQAKKQIASLKTSISDLVDTSLGKRGSFANQFEFDVAAAQAKAASKTISAGLKQNANDAKRFRMEFLGIMFFGQAMQRMFSGILRASFSTWSAITEGTSAAGGAVGQLSAAWEFFKFSLFDALANSGMFQSFVEFVLNLVEWWGNLSEKTKAWIAILLVIGAIIGTILFVVGQLGLGLDSIWMFLFGHNVQWKGLITHARTFWAFMVTKIIPSVIAFGKALLTNPIFWVVILIAGILLLAGYIVWLGVKLGGITELGKAMASGLIRLFGFIAETIVDIVGGAILWLMNKLIDLIGAIHKVAQVWDRMFGTHLADKVVNVIQHLEELRNTLFEFKESDFFTNMAEDLIVKWDLTPKEQGNEEVLGFDDYLKQISDTITGSFGQAGTDEDPYAPKKVEITNVDQLGRAVAENAVKPIYSGNTSRNLFNDEMSRQGLGEYQ